MIKTATERAESRSEEIVNEATVEAENRREAETDILLAKRKRLMISKTILLKSLLIWRQVVEKEINEAV